MANMLAWWGVLLLLLRVPCKTRAEEGPRIFGFSTIFSDSMVLQRDRGTFVYGYAPPDDAITVWLVRHSKVGAKPNVVQVVGARRISNSKRFWRVRLNPQSMQEYHYSIVAKSSILHESIYINNVTYGDVWYCASNAGYADSLKTDIFVDPAHRLRIYEPKREPQPFPMLTTATNTAPVPSIADMYSSNFGHWHDFDSSVDTRDNVRDALLRVCYREAVNNLKLGDSKGIVVVGLILATYPMTFLEAWIPVDSQIACSDAVCTGLAPVKLTRTNARSCQLTPPWGTGSDSAERKKDTPVDATKIGNSQLYNGMVSLFTSATVFGLLWGIVERDASEMSRCLLGAMSRSWLDAWSVRGNAAASGVAPFKVGYMDRSNASAAQLHSDRRFTPRSSRKERQSNPRERRDSLTPPAAITALPLDLRIRRIESFLKGANPEKRGAHSH